jgi:hypothetical protein
MHTTTTLLRTITVCVCALTVLSAEAQTLNAPDLPVGFSLQYGASAVDPGAEAGQDTTWDWSALPVAQVVALEFARRDSTVFGSMFPNATHAQIVQGQTATNYSYLGYDDVAMTYHGFIEGPTTLNYSEPQIMMPYPFSDGDVHTSAVDFQWSTGGIFVQRYDSLSMKVNGYGTLLDPFEGSFEVVRIEMHRAIRDSAVTGDGWILVDGVGFWQDGMPLPVAQTYTYHQVLEGDTTFLFSGAECLVDVVVGMEDESLSTLAPSLEMYPNPASDVLFVNGPVGAPVEVWNAAGEQVFTQVLEGSQSSVDVSGWPAGMYVVRLGQQVRRLVVQ